MQPELFSLAFETSCHLIPESPPPSTWSLGDWGPLLRRLALGDSTLAFWPGPPPWGKQSARPRGQSTQKLHLLLWTMLWDLGPKFPVEWSQVWFQCLPGPLAWVILWQLDHISGVCVPKSEGRPRGDHFWPPVDGAWPYLHEAPLVLLRPFVE